MITFLLLVTTALIAIRQRWEMREVSHSLLPILLNPRIHGMRLQDFRKIEIHRKNKYKQLQVPTTAFTLEQFHSDSETESWPYVMETEPASHNEPNLRTDEWIYSPTESRNSSSLNRTLFPADPRESRNWNMPPNAERVKCCFRATNTSSDSRNLS